MKGMDYGADKLTDGGVRDGAHGNADAGDDTVDTMVNVEAGLWEVMVNSRTASRKLQVKRIKSPPRES